MWPEIGTFITLLLQAVITAAVPILMAMLWKWIKAKMTQLTTNFSSECRCAIETAIEIAVRAAEQSGLMAKMKGEYFDKKAYAMDVAQNYLAELGWGTIDTTLLADLIEAEVIRSFPHNK